jgi:hypothetical protein
VLDLYNEFRSLIAVLNEQKIDYALCGGLAMAVYGVPRATVDIDLLILTSSLETVLSLAKAQGYNIRGPEMSFADGVIEIRRISKIDPGSGDLLSLDLLLVTSELLKVWQSRNQVVWEGGNLSVVSRDGLVFLKSLRSSGQDLDDIKKLQGV